MKVCVVGIGYVGLVTAGCLAEAGNNVICVDKDGTKIEGLKKGVIPIYEPGLAEIVQHNEKLKRLEFKTDLKYGVDNSSIIFLAVGTPPMADGSADISAILEVTGDIAAIMTDYRIIVTKSTVPIGTHKKAIKLIKSKTDKPFDYVSNPEFLKEGSAIEDFMSPDRIIIGTDSQQAREMMKQIYGPFMRKGNRLIFMDAASAEMTKYAANVMLATRISFMNEIAALCEKMGADIEAVRQGIGSDTRIGRAFLFTGVGFGGSCFPKDIRALIHTGEIEKSEMKIGKAAWLANVASQERFARRIIEYFGKKTKNPILGVWGLAFKAKTDDIRESPAINCIRKLSEHGMKIKAYDPEAAQNAKAALGARMEIFENGYDAIEGADALVILTDWQEFRNPDFELIAKKLKKPVIFDGRNLLDLDVVRKAGFEYYSIGRPAVK
ncbi:MAG: UDP-glucose/GDP-mannose dehydrogenase family protein [Sedimentisphaerales bacterium]|nr:UDP-glucose/GDP-mannose dehydrogenase family protein [Sedimentisphaerales bacterium]